nr:glycosyltransferase [Rhizobium sp. CSW-27]
MPSGGRASVSSESHIFYHYNELDSLLPDGLPGDDRWPRIVYARIFAPERLRSYTRLIYLDADILPLGIDQSIWAVSLSGGVGAIRDFATIASSAVPGRSKRDWLDSVGIRGGRYFNSGVLVIDVERWLTIDFRQLLPAYVAAFAKNMTFFDQDFLNYALQDIWSELSPRWNFQASLFNWGVDMLCRPLFVHFSKYEKPWFGQFDPEICDIDKLGHEYLVALCSADGIDLSGLRRPKKVDVLSRCKFFLRRHMSSAGMPSAKEKRLRNMADRLRSDFLEYVRCFSEEGRFADGWRPEAPAENRVAVFDGKVLRLPASAMMRNILQNPSSQPKAAAGSHAAVTPPVPDSEPSRSGGRTAD